MKTTLRTDITGKDICDGFVYNQLERGTHDEYLARIRGLKAALAPLI